MTGRGQPKRTDNCGRERKNTVENRTKGKRFGLGKVAVAVVALLLLGVMASSALAIRFTKIWRSSPVLAVTGICSR